MVEPSNLPRRLAVAARRVLLWPRQGLVLFVRIYRLLLSPWLGNSCRFEPSCSAYAIEALERHGALVGTGLTTYRLLRCHPWCAAGSDPVPEQPLHLFTGLLSHLSHSNLKKPSP